MTPRHVAYIMDGNGRWAEKRSLPRTAGYAEGLKAMLRVLRRTEELGADTATVYAFSAENFARPAEETAAILDVVRRWNDDYAGEWRVSYIGDLSRFPAPLRESIERVTERTAANRGLHLVIALGYGKTQGVAHKSRPLDEVIVSKGAPEWFLRGAEAALLAPTAVNQQIPTGLVGELSTEVAGIVPIE